LLAQVARAAAGIGFETAGCDYDRASGNAAFSAIRLKYQAERIRAGLDADQFVFGDQLDTTAPGCVEMLRHHPLAAVDRSYRQASPELLRAA
jgi:hypothetical protein